MAIKLDLGLKEEDRKALIDLLNTHLADQYALYTRLRNYHWNVTGKHFRTLHLLFEEQYTALETAIDETAERITTLGGRALGTLEELKAASNLVEKPGKYPKAMDMVADLAEDHQTIIRWLRESIYKASDHKDEGTADHFTGHIQAHEKMAWMLRVFIEEQGA